jgi:hypothetical protein
MFVNIIHFPPIKAGKDAEFREWFRLVERGVRQAQGLYPPAAALAPRRWELCSHRGA